jgi:hypothetical protein
LLINATRKAPIAFLVQRLSKLSAPLILFYLAAAAVAGGWVGRSITDNVMDDSNICGERQCASFLFC